MTLSYRYLNANLNILAKLGYPKAKALELLQLDETVLELSMDRMCLDPFVDCINVAAEFTSNPEIALCLGHKFRVGAFGQTGNLYAYCKDLDEVILMNDRYQKVAIDAGRVKYHVDVSSGHHQMRFLPYYTDMEKYQPITDMIMASYATTYRWLTWGSGDDILSAQLPYPRPCDVTMHEEIFQSNIIFQSENTCLEFSEAGALQNITTHDPERLTKAKVKLDKILGLQMEAQSFERSIEAAIRGAIESGQVSSHILAERMGMNWSTLRTKLNATGEGVRPRFDKIRKAMFMEKYEQGYSFAQIAMSLAYNDQPAMNRAFKRWFGMTPSQWRKQQSENSV